MQIRHCSSIIKKARDKLGTLGDGQVSLHKDDATGIATVTLQHQQRKNALSGKGKRDFLDVIHIYTHVNVLFYNIM